MPYLLCLTIIRAIRLVRSNSWSVSHPLGLWPCFLLNGVLERIFPERLQLTLGLLILSISGTAPFWYQGYYFVFATRLLFGLGVGMLNAKAISIISERYHGKTRITDAWFSWVCRSRRSIILTLAVGQLLAFGWTATFLAYAAGLVVLVLFLLFVPYGNAEVHESKHQTEEAVRLTASMKKLHFLPCYCSRSDCMYQYGHYLPHP